MVLRPDNQVLQQVVHVLSTFLFINFTNFGFVCLIFSIYVILGHLGYEQFEEE